MVSLPPMTRHEWQISRSGKAEGRTLFLACASAVDCDWFLTTDIGILKKVRQHGLTRVANPVEFAVEVQNAN